MDIFPKDIVDQLDRYVIGQKHYPVNYNLKHITLYILLSFSLYALMTILPIENTPIRLIINTVIILSFIAIAYKLDVKKLIRR